MIVHSISLQGKRESNEDKHTVILNMNGKNPRIKNVNYLAVFDGHGGYEVSHFIENNIKKYFLAKNVKYPLTRDYVNNVSNRLQNELKRTPPLESNLNYNSSSNVMSSSSKNMDRSDRSDRSIAEHCGTTYLIVIFFKHNNETYMNIANAGDCRCVICRDNLAIPLTKDHKPHWPEERERIQQIGGRIKWDGYDWRINNLSVSRSFGDIDSTPEVTHLCDLFRYKLTKNDKFIIIACDGLWDVVTNSEAVNYVIDNCKINNGQHNTTNIAKKLAKYAINKGSTDNVTVLIGFFK